MPPRTTCLKIQNLTFSYPEQRRHALEGVTLAVQPGEFLVLCGPSGCGKSTLLRQMKTVLAPHGQCTGKVRFEGAPLDGMDPRRQSQAIGFVQQSPENQLVIDKVWHELAFGLESLGYDTPTIRRRVAEMASFFGIQTWFYNNVAELSGGQKQLLNLASIMAMQPRLLILDEPTSQLDPIVASDFLAAIGKINRELGTTVVLTEHRLAEAFPLASRVAVMDKGRLLYTGTPDKVGEALRGAVSTHGPVGVLPQNPQARELVIIAVLCAIGVAGRAAFFMLPQFKPVMALTIIAGVAFGGETGFLVGAMTMLVSNVLYAQGPWTPWQMFCMGIIGFLAGVLFRKDWLRRSRESLCAFDVFAAIVIYGGIMNPASALMWPDELNTGVILTYYLCGFPMDCIHAAASALFLWFGAEPMLEKLDRIKVKYGLVEPG
ncbi:MAG: ATP-binding cassette domain-containing protein [Butyricicoccus pullicaecorum]|nr:ATP-binding cassette domain-containing protein [Butyricicoccus pullicaecorum]